LIFTHLESEMALAMRHDAQIRELANDLAQLRAQLGLGPLPLAPPAPPGITLEQVRFQLGREIMNIKDTLRAKYGIKIPDLE
jgi:hypothetical protein